MIPTDSYTLLVDIIQSSVLFSSAIAFLIAIFGK